MGQRLGPYEILAPIGAGGMGEVYRATDTRLKRDVALKFLPEAFVRDSGRMARFQREAEVLASLNHPNITAIYGIEDSSGSSALVMELAHGLTLAERIQQGPIPLDEALHIVRQIADGLEYAHEKNIVHRDLKPANVKITPEGTVKILDFGLAKAFSDDPSTTADPLSSPTLTMGQTLAGMILGTAAYMAPEQARGKAVDKRADIWAFGAVLYEMLTGRRLFQGEDVSEILAAVIKEEPQWDRIPQHVRPLLRRCLEKDPKRRLRDMGDAMPLVEASAAAQETLVPQPAAAQSRRSWLAWSAAGLFFAIVGAAPPFALLYLREQPPAVEAVRFEIQAPPKTNFGTQLALSPDGRHLAFTATGSEGGTSIWVRDLDKPEARALAGTENAGCIIWSPDSRFIAFGSGNQLKKSDFSGGSAATFV
jgi:serine/threonine protein kinase